MCKDPWTRTVPAGTMDSPQTESLHRFFCLFFVDINSWGHICTDRLFDDYSAGLCFSRANADLRYIQSEMPSTLQPQSLFDFGFLPSLRGLFSSDSILTCGVPLQGSMLRAKAEEISQ